MRMYILFYIKVVNNYYAQNYVQLRILLRIFFSLKKKTLFFRSILCSSFDKKILQAIYFSIKLRLSCHFSVISVSFFITNPIFFYDFVFSWAIFKLYFRKKRAHVIYSDWFMDSLPYKSLNISLKYERVFFLFIIHWFSSPYFSVN